MASIDNTPTGGALKFVQASERVVRQGYVIYLDDDGREVARHRARKGGRQ